jgi:phospholipid/cholesterol/gamma-HCH transport system permease protein
MNRLASLVASIGEFTHFALRSLAAGVAAIARPAAVLRQLYAVLIGALPLGLVAGVALGAVVWMHSHAVLARTGTADYLPTLLAVAVLLELAPIGAGLIVAARTGASFGAELGSRRLSEQIDALEMLGISPMRQLVGPRVLACMIALPVLHIFIAVLAIGSGFIAENIVASSSWLKYQTGALRELYTHDVVPAMLKTIVFGYLIGVAGCFFGMRARGGTEGIGRAATNGVVASCLLVMAADVLLVGLIQAFVTS